MSSKGGNAEDVEVTRQDQDMINSYGKLNNKLSELKRSKTTFQVSFQPNCKNKRKETSISSVVVWELDCPVLCGCCHEMD